VTEDRTPESLGVLQRRLCPVSWSDCEGSDCPIARLIGFKSAVAELSLAMLLCSVSLARSAFGVQPRRESLGRHSRNPSCLLSSTMCSHRSSCTCSVFRLSYAILQLACIANRKERAFLTPWAHLVSLRLSPVRIASVLRMFYGTKSLRSPLKALKIRALQ
jgi:hypothetical protein